MSAFIANMIERAARISIEDGQAKYRAYFVRTTLYTAYKADADTILITDGFTDVIVSA